MMLLRAAPTPTTAPPHVLLSLEVQVACLVHKFKGLILRLVILQQRCIWLSMLLDVHKGTPQKNKTGFTLT